MDGRDFFKLPAHYDPVVDDGFAMRRQFDMQPHRGIHGALGNRVTAELAIFGIAPGAFGVANPFCSGGELVDAEVH